MPAYRLAIIDEQTGRVVARLNRVSSAVVHGAAAGIADLMPVLRAAIRVKDTVTDLGLAMRWVKNKAAATPRRKRVEK